MNGGDNSITGGLILAAVLIGLSVLVDYLTYRSKACEGVLQGRPTLLIHQGKLLHPNLEKELLNVHEVKTMLRRQGIHDLAEVREAVLESGGWISVIKKDEPA